MPKIKNMGTATMRFGEGIIVTGSADLDPSGHNSLIVSGNVKIVEGGLTAASFISSEDIAIFGGNVYVDENIRHTGDVDTLINFADNKIVLKAGNLALVTAEKNSSAPHEVTINDGSNNVDFVVKGNGSNQGNPGMKFDASTNKLGINGIGTPAYELEVAGNIGLAEYIYHRNDDNTYIRFQDDDINLQAGGRSMIKISEGSIDQVLIMSGGSGTSPDVKTSTDTNFFVSGSAGSRGSSTAGTSTFGGDVVISGSLYAKQRHVQSIKYNSTDSSQQYVRFDAAGSNSTPGVNNKFLAPASGRLLFLVIRCTTNANGTNIAFHKASNGSANVNTTATETIGVDINAAHNSFQVQFTEASSFNAGDILGISVNPSSTPNDVNITCVWEFDFTD